MAVIDKIKDALHINSTDSAAAPSTSTTAPPHGAKSSAPTGDDKLPSLPDVEVFDHDKVTVIFVLGGPGAGEWPAPAGLSYKQYIRSCYPTLLSKTSSDYSARGGLCGD